MLDGLSFTVLEAPHPLDDPDRIETYNAREQFTVARRVWLGWNGGTDWLHDAVEVDFGADAVAYEVRSQRNATHVGAAGEWSQVLLILMGMGALDFARKVYGGFAQRLGEVGAEAMIEWARKKSQERRAQKGWEKADGPPHFAEGWGGPEALVSVMRDELADVACLPAARLHPIQFEARHGLSLYAIFEDEKTRTRYLVEVRRDDATFTRLPSEAR